MTRELTIRPARREELGAVLDLWRSAEAEPTRTDDLESLSGLFERDPGALLVAEEAGELVGTVIGAFDGWRGSIYRLAVRPDARHRGVAGRLVEAAAHHLDELGARRSGALVHQSNPHASGFWRTTGWEEQDDWLRFARG